MTFRTLLCAYCYFSNLLQQEQNMAWLQAWLGPLNVPTSRNKQSKQSNQVEFQVYSKLGGNYLASLQVEPSKTFESQVHPKVGDSYLTTIIDKQALEAIAKTASRIMPHTPELSWQSMVVEVVGAKALVSWDVDKAKALLKQMHQAAYKERQCLLTLVLGKSTNVLPEVAVYESCTKCVIYGKMALAKQVKKNKVVYVELCALTNMPSLCDLKLNLGNFSISSLPQKLTNLRIENARVKTWPSTLPGLTHLCLHMVDLTATTIQKPTLRVLVGAIQEPTLLVLVARQAGLEGTLPIELSGFPRLNCLDLRGNSLCGDIPSFVKDLACLKRLDLSGNCLSSNIPAFFGDLACLETLDLSSNCLVGTIPTALGRAARLVDLSLQDNYLEGALPSELKHLGLVKVNLSHNQLTGCLSNKVFGPGIQELDLSFNSFSSLEPDAFSDMTALTTCKLSNNRLVGNIPTSIGMLVACVNVDLSHNYLASMPSELGLVGSAARGNLTLLLHDNRITGSIPPQVFTEHISKLDLSNNRLSGRLPSEVGLLRNAETLNLANNRLFGSVPCELGLGRATLVDISGNRFQGKLSKRVSTLGRSGKHRGTLVFDEALVYNHELFAHLDLVPIGNVTY